MTKNPGTKAVKSTRSSARTKPHAATYHVKLIPTAEQAGVKPPSTLWHGFVKTLITPALAREAASIFIDLARAHNPNLHDITAADIHEGDLARLGDESLDFMDRVDAAPWWQDTSPAERDFTWLLEFGGIHFALARVGSEFAYEEFGDPDPRRQLIAEAQTYQLAAPYVDQWGDVRLFAPGSEPPRTRADATARPLVGAAPVVGPVPGAPRKGEPR